ncbi:hypothetical protein ACFSWD_28380 [Paenibacillus xanthanilyticus]
MTQKNKQAEIEIFSEGINVTITGEGDEKVFGNVDLSLKAAVATIEMLDFKFALDVDDNYAQKAHVQLLHAIGGSIKAGGFYPSEATNLQVAQSFLNWFLENKLDKEPEYAELLKQDEDEADFSFPLFGEEKN